MKRGCILLAALALWACGGDQTPEPLPPAGSCDQELLSQCLVNQQICVVGEAGPSCQRCDAGHYATRAGSCDPIGGEPLHHEFPPNTTAAGGELRGLCRSWTIDNPEPLYVNAVEIDQDEASHHSNWTFVPDSQFDGPDGIWPCAERNYNQLTGALAGGVLYAQSTQATHEVQKFPSGVVVRIPAQARIISDIHTLNTSPDSVTGTMRLTLYALPESDVTVKLAPFHLSYDELTIPPQSDSRFSGGCADIAGEFTQLGETFAMQLYYLLPHTHALGTRMFVEVLGGPNDGDTLVDVTGFNGEARGLAFDPPIALDGAQGLRFGCEFHNPRNEMVVWGFDDQEMCETLGFAASPVAFESRISEALPDGAEDGIQRFTGDCATVAFAWDTDR
jgi:hypothetical protein